MPEFDHELFFAKFASVEAEAMLRSYSVYLGPRLTREDLEEIVSTSLAITYYRFRQGRIHQANELIAAGKYDELTCVLRAFARRTARRRIIDHLRGNHFRPQFVSLSENQPDIAIRQEEPTFTEDEHALRVRRVLDLLPWKQRILLMSLLQSDPPPTNAELAEQFGVPVSTIKSELHRARVAFRDNWNRLYPEEPI